MLKRVCKLLLLLITCLFVGTASNATVFTSAKHLSVSIDKIIKQGAVAVIGFNAGRANCFLHINNTRKDIIIVDCGQYMTELGNLPNKVIQVLTGFTEKGYKLKYVIISHEHLDHRSIWDDELCKHFTQIRLIRTNSNIDGQIVDGIIKFIQVKDRNTTRENSKSLVCYIDGMVYMGDLDSGLLDFSILGCDPIYGMVFPHHGSTTHNSRAVRNQVMEHQLKKGTPIRFAFISNNLKNRTKFEASRPSIGFIPAKSTPIEHITNSSTLPRHIIVTNDRESTKALPLAHIVVYSLKDTSAYRAIIYDQSYYMSNFETIYQSYISAQSTEAISDANFQLKEGAGLPEDD